MSTVMAWCGFIGAWLLVAAAVYQAALELRSEELERDEIDRVKQDAKPEERLSPWWWLFPPAGYLLQRRESRRYRAEVLNRLTHEQVESLVHYLEKAQAWTMLALGAFLVALAATWNIWERDGWPEPTYVVVVLALAIVSTANTVLRLRHADQVLSGHAAAAATE